MQVGDGAIELHVELQELADDRSTVVEGPVIVVVSKVVAVAVEVFNVS